MDFLRFMFTPLLCAVIGYSTNWLAIKMLFRPHKEIRLFGCKLPFTPGLIPKERLRLAGKIAETVSRHVLTPEVLARELAALAKSWNIREKADSMQMERLIDWLKAALDDNPAIEEWLVGMVRNIIREHVGRLAGIFLDPGKIYASIKEGLFEYLSDPENQALMMAKTEESIHALGFGRAMENVVTYIAHHIPIKEMIENKINAFAVDEAERIILSVISRELHVIMALGGILGFFIGFLALLLP